MKPNQLEHQHLLVSIIMPVRNEARYIRRCLDALAAQDYPAEDLEIIIADGMSRDDTREIITQFINQNPHLRLILMDNPGRIVPTGLNAALRKAQGEIITRVDGHTIIMPDYVSQCVAELLRTGAGNVGGKMRAVGEGEFGKAVVLATSSIFGVGGARFHYSDKEEWVDTVYLGAWKFDMFRQIGLFDEELVRDQDDEFNYRLRKRGYRILLSPKIRSEYSARSSPIALWRQYFQYGYWKVRVMQKHPRQMRSRQFVPLAFVLSLITAGTWSLFSIYGRYLLGILLGAHLSTSIMISIKHVKQHGWQVLYLLPLTYIILHLSYGLGFLTGLVRFANRWKDRKGLVPSFHDQDVPVV